MPPGIGYPINRNQGQGQSRGLLQGITPTPTQLGGSLGNVDLNRGATPSLPSSAIAARNVAGVQRQGGQQGVQGPLTRRLSGLQPRNIRAFGGAPPPGILGGIQAPFQGGRFNPAIQAIINQRLNGFTPGRATLARAPIASQSIAPINDPINTIQPVPGSPSPFPQDSSYSGLFGQDKRRFGGGF